MKAIDELGEGLSRASVADKVVGKAAALLCVYSDIVATYAVTASESGLEVLRKNGIPYEFDTQVPVILDAKKN